jgi:hypothetical protein
MRYAVATAFILLAGSALAQPANMTGRTPAIASSTTPNLDAPVAGANSFTAGQAKSRMENAGYSGVSALSKDKDGVWHATASKAGKPYQVTLDFQGNITAN